MITPADLVAVATLFLILTAIFCGYVSVVWIVVIMRRSRQQNVFQQLTARRVARRLAAAQAARAEP